MSKIKYYKDPNGKHLRVYHSLMNAPAFLALSATTQMIYLRMKMQLGATNNGDISATLTTLKHHGVKSSSTLAKALRELQTLGFIEKTYQGGINGHTQKRNCSLYRFTDTDSHDIPKKGITGKRATHDYKQIDSIRAAQAILKQISMEAKTEQAKKRRKNKSPVRNSNLTASEFEPKADILGSEFEQFDFLRVRKLNLSNLDILLLKPVTTRDLEVLRTLH